ncbi:AbrB/MazE/SpoVT family DNA-binding domain-containing protein [Acidiferrimicrobium sp. IK]|nr:AbrB/MazE/SpoVT family DNA-binding domain-containing protein [Acidiferrimicrobium sp. IK]
MPKAVRDALGLTAGTALDVSVYGSALTLTPHGRTASIVEEQGRLVSDPGIVITDDEMFSLIDAGRR